MGASINAHAGAQLRLCRVLQDSIEFSLAGGAIDGVIPIQSCSRHLIFIACACLDVCMYVCMPLSEMVTTSCRDFFLCLTYHQRTMQPNMVILQQKLRVNTQHMVAMVVDTSIVIDIAIPESTLHDEFITFECHAASWHEFASILSNSGKFNLPRQPLTYVDIRYSIK